MLLFRILIFAFLVVGFPLQGYANISTPHPSSDQDLQEFFISLFLAIVFTIHLRNKALKYIPPIGILLGVLWFLHVMDIFDQIKFNARCESLEHFILIVMGLLPGVYFAYEMLIQQTTDRGPEKKSVFKLSRPVVVGVILAAVCLFYAADTIAGYESYVCKPMPLPLKESVNGATSNGVTFKNVSHVDYYPSPLEMVFTWIFVFLTKFTIVYFIFGIKRPPKE